MNAEYFKPVFDYILLPGGALLLLARGLKPLVTQAELFLSNFHRYFRKERRSKNLAKKDITEERRRNSRTKAFPLFVGTKAYAFSFIIFLLAYIFVGAFSKQFTLPKI